MGKPPLPLTGAESDLIQSSKIDKIRVVTTNKRHQGDGGRADGEMQLATYNVKKIHFTSSMLVF